MHIQSFVTTSNGLDSLTVANNVEQALRSTTKTCLLLSLSNNINLHLLHHQLMPITSILQQLKSDQTQGHISHSFHISPHNTYNIQITLIPILYILCWYIASNPHLYHNPFLLVYPPIFSTLVITIKYHTAGKYIVLYTP